MSPEHTHEEEIARLQLKVSEIHRYAEYMDVAVEESEGEVRMLVDGKRVFGRPDPYTLWFYMAGYRDGARYAAPKFSKRWLHSRISRAITSAINDHGPIKNGNVSSAAKRVVGQLQSLAFALFTEAGVQEEGDAPIPPSKRHPAAPRPAPGRAGET